MRFLPRIPAISGCQEPQEGDQGVSEAGAYRARLRRPREAAWASSCRKWGARKGFKAGRNTTPGLCSEVTLAAGMEELGDQGGPDWKHGAGGAGREEELGWDHLSRSGLGDDYLDVRDQAEGETHQNACGQVSE